MHTESSHLQILRAGGSNHESETDQDTTEQEKDGIDIETECCKDSDGNHGIEGSVHNFIVCNWRRMNWFRVSRCPSMFRGLTCLFNSTYMHCQSAKSCECLLEGGAAVYTHWNQQSKIYVVRREPVSMSLLSPQDEWIAAYPSIDLMKSNFEISPRRFGRNTSGKQSQRLH